MGRMSGYTVALILLTGSAYGDMASEVSADTSTAATQAATTTTLATSTDPSIFGQSLRLIATVTAVSGTPAGTVNFLNGTATLGSAKLSDGVASLVTAGWGAGTRSITAVYGGNTNFLAGTSVVLTQVVNRAQTALALTSSANPATVGNR